MPKGYVNTLDCILLSITIRDDGCWTLPHKHNGRGYVRIELRGQRYSAHRLLYETLRGPIEEGLVLDHLCRNRACVNPDHLEPVSCGENLLRGETANARRAAQTHCVNGHPFDEVNTHYRKEGHRECRVCMLIRERRRIAKLRGPYVEHPLKLVSGDAE